MLISFNTFFNCLSLVTLHLIRSLDAINNDKNWNSFDAKTLYFISDLNETTDWQTADTICRQRSSNLVSIHSQIQNEFLANRTKYLGQQFWIGLRGDSEVHLWSDNQPFDYNNLIDEKAAKTLVFEHKCATFESVSGVWKYNDCTDNKFGYICQKSSVLRNEPKNINEVVQDANYKRCQITGFRSAEGINYGEHCYMFFDKIGLDWNEAQQECRKINGSSLLSIDSSTEMQFIRNYTLLNFNSSDFWIGLYAKRNSSQIHFQWSDGSAVNMTYWRQKEPSIGWNSSSDMCVFQKRETSEWTVDFCTHKRHFICKSSDKTKPPNTKNYTKYACPPAHHEINWVNIDNNSEFCYWFSEDFDKSLLKTTWTEASFKCRLLNSTLVSIHSMEGLLKMKNRISENTWIGLSQNEKGYFKWDDNSGLDFTYWDNQHSLSNALGKCVSVQPTQDFEWTLNQCFDKSNIFDFICQTRKTVIPDKSHSTTETPEKFKTSVTMNSETTEVPKVKTTNTPTNSSHLLDKSGEQTDSGLPSLAKYGFILLGLIIIISISINVYIVGKKVKFRKYFKRDPKSKRAKNTERRQRDDILNSSDPNVVFSNIRLR